MSLRKGLVGHWTMNDSDTSGDTLYDRSAQDRHASLSSVTSGASGIVGESFDFSSSSLDPEFSQEQNNISVGAWFKVDSGATDGMVWNIASNKSNGLGLRVNETNAEIYDDTAGNDVFPLTTSINSDVWIHSVVTINSQTVEMFLDTVSSGTYSQDAVNTTYFSIGSRFAGDTSTLAFDGNIDDVRLYNRALSDSEISALYNMRSQRQKTSDLQKGLVGHWTLDAGATSNGTAYDSSANDNHGTLNGGVTTGVSGQVGEAYSFDGDNDYVEVGDVINEAEGTITFWFNTDEITNYVTLSDNSIDQNAWEIWVDTNAVLQAQWSGVGGPDNIRARKEITTGVWYMATVTWVDGGNATIYADAGNADSRAYSTSSAETHYINSGNGGNDNGDCKIDDFRIYNRVLSQSEIQRLYNKR